MAVSIVRNNHHGEPDGFEEYTLQNGSGVMLQVITLGATVTRLHVPDRTGRSANIVLGFPDLSSYRHNKPRFGATIGRYANRIANGRFTLDGHEYRLPVNDPPNTLHGGTDGFDKAVWQVDAAQGAGNEAFVQMRHVNPDGDQGFPGRLDVTLRFSLNEAGEFRLDYKAETDKATVLNLTNHSYFNLSGEGSGSIEHHELQIAAGRFTPVGDDSIPTGEIAAVDGTPLDFRKATTIGERLRSSGEQMLRAHGYDFNWVLEEKAGGAPMFAARLRDPQSGRTLDVSTTQPAIQIYTANKLDGTIVGTSGKTYRQSDGVALETQHFPDSPNHPNFPSTVLRPGEQFSSTTIYKFFVS